MLLLLCRIDPFTRKDWYDVKAPAIFANRNVGKTLVNRTQGTSEYCLLTHPLIVVTLNTIIALRGHRSVRSSLRPVPFFQIYCYSISLFLSFFLLLQTYCSRVCRVRCTVWDTHPVHGIPIPYSLCLMVPSI